VAKGNYEWDNSCGGECYYVIVPKCSRGDGTTEPDVRTLKVKFKGCDREMQFIYRGNNYMPVLNIYLERLRFFDEQVPTHKKTKYPM
jgi:hypothetical protein